MDALRFHTFGFSYAEAAAPVLFGVDWAVPRGAFALLEGPTGSGKTTLLRCAHPVLAPTGTRSGQVDVMDVPWDRLHARRERACAVAYVGQHPAEQLVCDSVWHEMAFGLENEGVDQDEMRRRVAEVAHFFGIEPWFHRACDQLSGGQQQILNLASALCLQPQLLLLDEPTAQLDPVAASQFAHALFRINRELGITVVVATHDALVLRPYATASFHMESGHVDEGVWEMPAPSDGAAAPADDVQDGRGSDSVVFDQAFFRYERDADWVLRGLDLHVCAGSVHALVGGNGCGKTTALMCAAGALRPVRGHVRNASHAQALLPQDPKALMVCDTVEAELREWQQRCGYDDDAVDRMVARFHLESVLQRHPFDTSGGQQQSIALAKLLLTDPDLLLLDEPTKGLDVPARRMLASTVRDLHQAGVTVVLATHDLAFVAAVSQTVTMLFDGQAASTESCGRFFQRNVFFRPSQAACAQLGVAWEDGR